MSANHDDRLGELSGPERDFALRRMPIQTLSDAYQAANVPPADLGAPLPAGVDVGAILRALDRLTALGTRLYRRQDFHSSHNALSIERDIRKALNLK